MRSFKEIDPPIITAVSEKEQKIFVTCDDVLKIDMVYDVYVVGWINNYESSTDDSYNKMLLKKEEIYPFKVHIGEPYWMVFNTAPSVDWVPADRKMNAGESWELTFGAAMDFESNKVYLDFVQMMSIDDAGGQDFSNWLKVTNATMLDSCIVVVNIPSDAPGMVLSLEITIADNHDRMPLSSTFKTAITVEDKEEAG